MKPQTQHIENFGYEVGILQSNQNLYLNVVIRNQNGVVIATDSINSTGNYPDYLDFTATAGNTYYIEFFMRNVCGTKSINGFFEVDDVFVSYGKQVVVENKEYVVSGGYRYGFNGMERDDNVKGAGNHYDLGLRNYDPRIGRMFSIDPRANEYPWQTTYAYHRNSPIMMIDYLGGGDADGIYIDEETGEFLGEDEFGADDGLVHYTSRENWDKYGNSPWANKSDFLKKDSGVSLTIDVFDEIAKKLNGLILPKFSDEMTLATNLYTSVISGLAENSANAKFKYPDPKPLSDAAKNSFKNLAKAAQKFVLFYTVTDKGIMMYNALNQNDISKFTQEAVVLSGYMVAYVMMGTPSPFGVTQVAGALVFIGTTAYDLFTD